MAPPLLEAAEEALAQSLLIFLYADLRILSATGRIHTKFENLCIDSDIESKTTAARLAALDDCAVVVPAKDDPRQTQGPTSITKGGNKGISPAQIMAALMLEIREETLKQKEFEQQAEQAKGEGLHRESIFAPSQNKKDQNREESTHTLMRAYTKMIREDLDENFRGVNPKRHLGTVADSTTLDPEILENIYGDSQEIPQMEKVEEEEEEMDEVVVMEEVQKDEDEQQQQQGDESKEKTEPPVAKGRRFSLPVFEKKPQISSSASGDDKRRGVMRLSLPVTGAQAIGGEVENRRAALMTKVDTRRDSIRRITQAAVQGEDAVARDQLEQVGDAFFNAGGKMTPEQMGKLMERAVNSRIYGQLDFLADMFREGTVSQLTAKSKAKIVWINDWHPIKDLVYAISVDEEKKRVLAVFRGCQTEADWEASYDANLTKVKNPIPEDYEGKNDQVDVYHGFFRYLFRVRKDTGTTKYHEIANKVHHYGMDRIGPDYTLSVTGHSLGGALTTLFGFCASADKRFTRNGPVRLMTFGSPRVGGHLFADAFRHQEECGKLQHARFFNTRDLVAHLPVNLIPSKNGSRYVDVGVGIKLQRKLHCSALCRTDLPKIYYTPKEGFVASYWRALRKNCFFNMPFPWRIRLIHALDKHQTRLLRAKKRAEEHEDHPVNKSMDEIYEVLVIEKKSS